MFGPGTEKDFREIVAEHDAPCITHELGQWTVYPNMAEIPKYSGALRARNFELIRDDLKAKGMLELAPRFTEATGRQMVELYKEEIESQYRTPGTIGFQLLDLHDFPGQGSAIVGTLDAFWDSKGLVEPAQFRRWCGPTVPLLKFARRVYTVGEVFSAEAEILHYGAADLKDAVLEWSIRDGQGGEAAAGSFAARTLPQGARTSLGRIEAPLGRAASPAQLVVTLGVRGTAISNEWRIWVYPDRLETTPPSDVTVTRVWNDRTRAALADGAKVLLMAAGTADGKSLPGSFMPPFWSPIWFKHENKTMSILCDPAHPVFARFPTQMHTDWQWHDLLEKSHAVVLDGAPKTYRPIVQVIDNFTRNHRLGNLFEAKVGAGRLLVCSIDLHTALDQRPAARQLLASLYEYMASDAFQPTESLEPSLLADIFLPHVPTSKPDKPEKGDKKTAT
jgi:hypothetical protein